MSTQSNNVIPAFASIWNTPSPSPPVPILHLVTTWPTSPIPMMLRIHQPDFNPSLPGNTILALLEPNSILQLRGVSKVMKGWVDSVNHRSFHTIYYHRLLRKCSNSLSLETLRPLAAHVKKLHIKVSPIAYEVRGDSREQERLRGLFNLLPNLKHIHITAKCSPAGYAAFARSENRQSNQKDQEDSISANAVVIPDNWMVDVQEGSSSPSRKLMYNAQVATTTEITSADDVLSGVWRWPYPPNSHSQDDMSVALSHHGPYVDIREALELSELGHNRSKGRLTAEKGQALELTLSPLSITALLALRPSDSTVLHTSRYSYVADTQEATPRSKHKTPGGFWSSIEYLDVSMVKWWNGEAISELVENINPSVPTKVPIIGSENEKNLENNAIEMSRQSLDNYHAAYSDMSHRGFSQDNYQAGIEMLHHWLSSLSPNLQTVKFAWLEPSVPARSVPVNRRAIIEGYLDTVIPCTESKLYPCLGPKIWLLDQLDTTCTWFSAPPIKWSRLRELVVYGTGPLTKEDMSYLLGKAPKLVALKMAANRTARLLAVTWEREEDGHAGVQPILLGPEASHQNAEKTDAQWKGKLQRFGEAVNGVWRGLGKVTEKEVSKDGQNSNVRGKEKVQKPATKVIFERL